MNEPLDWPLRKGAQIASCKLLDLDKHRPSSPHAARMASTEKRVMEPAGQCSGEASESSSMWLGRCGHTRPSASFSPWQGTQTGFAASHAPLLVTKPSRAAMTTPSGSGAPLPVVNQPHLIKRLLSSIVLGVSKELLNVFSCLLYLGIQSVYTR